MSTDNIKAVVKVRPQIQQESQDKQKPLWYVKDNYIINVDDVCQSYSFDHVFDEAQCNRDVYENSVRPLVMASLTGINSTIFAYGQTSSGKTHTMLGNSADPGIMLQALDDIFKHIAETQERQFLVRCSYLEIYNERINDLLNNDKKSGQDIKIREGLEGPHADVKEEVINEPSQGLSLMKMGSKIRKIGCTDMNERSSRSHTIFKIIIQSQPKSEEVIEPTIQAQLNLVDLAGSERVGQTKATGHTKKEGVHINKSLHALGIVMRKLSEGAPFVGYRDSKLTRLLQSALGGNTKTLVIATVTLAAAEETRSTLEFGQIARTVENLPTINVKMDLKEHNEELERLATSYMNKMEQVKIEKIKAEKIIQEYNEKIKHLNSFLLSKEQSVESEKLSYRRRHTIHTGSRPCHVFSTPASPAESSRVSETDIYTSILERIDEEPENIYDIDMDEEQIEEIEKVVVATPTCLDDFYESDILESCLGEEKKELMEVASTPEPSSELLDAQELEQDTPPSVLRQRLASLDKSLRALEQFTKLETEISPSQTEMIHELKEQIEALQENAIEVQSEYAETTKKVESITEEMKSYKNEILKLKLENSKYETLVLQLNETNETLKSEIVQIKNDNEYVLEQKQQTYGAKLKLYQEEIEELRLTKKCDEMVKLRKLVDEKDDHMKYLENLITELDDKCFTLMDDLETERSTKEQLLLQMEHINTEKETTLRESADKNEQEIKNFRKKMHSMHKKHVREFKKFKFTISKLKLKNSSLKRRNSKLKVIVAKKKREPRKMEDVELIEQLERQLTTKEYTLQQLSKQTETLQASNEGKETEIKKKMDEFLKQKSRGAELQCQIDELNKEIDNYQEIAKEYLHFKREVADYQSEITYRDHVIRTFQQTNSELEKLLKNSESANKMELFQKIKRLELHLLESENENRLLNNETSKLHKFNHVLFDQMNQKLRIISQLQHELNRKTEDWTKIGKPAIPDDVESLKSDLYNLEKQSPKENIFIGPSCNLPFKQTYPNVAKAEEIYEIFSKLLDDNQAALTKKINDLELLKTENLSLKLRQKENDESVQDLANRYKDATKRNISLENSNLDISEKLSRCETENKNLKIEIQSLLNEIAQKHHEKMKLEELLTTSEMNYKCSIQKERECHENLCKLQKDNDNLRKSLDDYAIIKQGISHLESKNALLLDKLSASEDVNNKITDLEKKIKSLKQTLFEREEKLLNISQQNVEYNNKICSLQHEVEQLHKSKDELQCINNQLSCNLSDKNEQTNKIESLKQTLFEREEKLVIVCQQNVEYNIKICSLQHEVEQLHKSKDELQCMNNQLSCNLSDKDEQISSMESQQEGAKQTISQLRHELKLLFDQVATLKTEVNSSKTDLELEKTRCNTAIQNGKDLNNKMIKLDEENKNLRTTLSETQQDLKDECKKLEKLREALEENESIAKKKHIQLEDENQALQQKTFECTQELERIRTEYVELKTENTDLRKSKDLINNKIKDYQAEIELHKSGTRKLSAVAKQLADCQCENSQLKNQLSYEKSCNKDYAEKIVQLEREINKLHNKLRGQQSPSPIEKYDLSVMQQHNGKLAQEVEKCKQMVLELKQERNLAQRKYADVNQKISDYKDRSKFKDEQISDLQNKLIESQGVIKELKEHIKIFEAKAVAPVSISPSSASLKSVESPQEARRRKRHEFHDQNRPLDEVEDCMSCETLKAQNEHLQRTFEKQDEKLSRAEKDLEDLCLEIGSRDKEIQILKGEINSLMEKEKGNLLSGGKKEKLEKDSQKIMKIYDLKIELDQLKKDNERLQREIQTLHNYRGSVPAPSQEPKAESSDQTCQVQIPNNEVEVLKQKCQQYKVLSVRRGREVLYLKAKLGIDPNAPVLPEDCGDNARPPN